jgi:5S rRNA maturation endonuclease (ribonuclease M5)
MSDGVISLWTKVPEYGDRIVICSSLKDALVLSCQLHIPAIALQGEGYNISDTACNELRRRYKKVFICFDVDEPGKKDAKTLSEKTGFPFIVPDLGTEKDLSDHFKSLENKDEFKKLETLFH